MIIDNEKWLRFELNSKIASTEQFEIGFCREFFAIQQGIKLDEVQIIDGARGIENEPINGIAYQAKFTKDWSWTQIKSSLEKVLKYYKKYYPNLNKIFVYVKTIKSDKYLEEINKKGGILQKLKKIGIEVEIYAKWEKIWEEDKYEELKGYFKEKQDLGYQIKLVEKYLENLYLDISEDLLDGIFQKFEHLEPKQQANYYIYLARLKEYKNLFQVSDDKKDKSFYEDLIKSYKYLKNNKTKLNKAIGLYFLEEKKEAKVIIDNLMKKDNFNESLYGFYLMTEKENYNNFSDLYKIVKNKYKNKQYVRGILGNIFRNMGGEDIGAFEKFYKQDYSKIEKLSDKIIYFRIWSNYLNEKYGLYNLSFDAKEAYLELDSFVDTFIDEIYGKKLMVELELLNTKAVINSQIKLDIGKADDFFNKSLKKQDSGVIRVNKILNLLHSNESRYREEARKLLEDIYDDFEKYLELEKNNPNKDILYQIHGLLAQEYLEEYNEVKSRGHIPSEELKSKGLKILKNFKIKYYDKVSDFHKRNFGLLDIQSEPEKAKDKIIDYLKENNYIVYNLLAYNFLKDEKYIYNAYKIYKSGKEDDFKSVAQLADAFLYRLKDEGKFFEMMDNELNNLSNIKYFKDYIFIGIKLGKSKIVNSKLKEYKKENGVDYYYTMLKSYFEEKKGDKKKALEIIKNFENLDDYIDLLFGKSKFEYDLDDLNYKKTLKHIYKIGKKTNFSKFKIEDKLSFISSYGLVDLEKSIEVCYDFLQDKNIEDKQLLDFKKIYFSLAIQAEHSGIKFLNKKINKDSVVIIKNLFDNEKQTISLDLNSNKIYGFDKVLDKENESYNKLIGKKVGDTIINLFGERLIKQEFKIIEIRHKYDFLHGLMFSKYSDEVLGAIKIRCPTINGKIDLTPFLELNNKLGKQEKNRKKYINKNFTNKGLLTFKILKHFYGESYIDNYYQNDFELLKSDQLFKLGEGEGEKIKSIMLDPSSIISIFEFGLEDIVKNNFTLFISQSTFESFKDDLAKLNNEPKSEMSVHSDGEGNHYKNEISKEDYGNREEYLGKIINFLKNNCKREKSNLLLSKEEKIEAILGKEFYDSLLIAQDKGYYLFSEEQVLRGLARNDKIKTFGIESFLMYLNSQKLINSDFLFESYIKLIDLNFNGLLINSGLIYLLLIKEDINNLEKVILYTKEKYNDINFIVSTLIYIVLRIKNFKGIMGNIGLEFKEGARKYYFEILYKIILNHYEKSKVEKMFFILVGRLDNEDDKKELKGIFK